MEAIKLCRLDTPIIFIEARINLSRFVVTGCAAKTSATVTFPSLNLISLFRSEERFSRNAETDLVCRLLLEKKKMQRLYRESNNQIRIAVDRRTDTEGQSSYGDVTQVVRLV